MSKPESQIPNFTVLDKSDYFVVSKKSGEVVLPASENMVLHVCAYQDKQIGIVTKKGEDYEVGDLALPKH